ncbi:MAG: hypothetical protein JW913_18530 [Chitinispirillaceae bacterium]|nr:hypothetical protein [Chitinispirillaceae bacterium]
MFTIHKKRGGGTEGARRPLRVKYGAACCCTVLLLFTDILAQCGFRENGYLFLHPFFNNVNWQATIYTAAVFPAEAMCTEKPAGIAVSRAAALGTVVYTTTAGMWMLTRGPLVNNTCLCCRPTIEFGEPIEIAVPAALALQASLPFHLLTRESAGGDSAYLVAASSGNRVYCMHIHRSSGAIGGIDTLTVNLVGQQAISGVWGEPDGAASDTALWIGGSSGLLWLIPFKNGQWGTRQEIAIDNSETVSAIGGGYAGTVSGKIYRRSGASFTLDNSSASSPLRSINRRIAVGDVGTVLINRSGSWRSYDSGNVDYRFGNLTANAGGTAVELLDNAWNYTTRTLFDSATTISGVSPSEVAASLNGDPFKFNLHGTLTATIRIRDIDDNREIPSVILKSGSITTAVNKAADNTTLLRHNPAAVCTTTKAFFNDTLVKLVISGDEVKLETQAQRGVRNASCDFWNWQSFLFTATGAWKYADTLVVTLGKDTLMIINDSQATVTTTASGMDPRAAMTALLIRRENRRIHFHSGVSSGVRRIVLVDAAGRLIWECAVAPSARTTIVSPEFSSGIHLVIIDYVDGRSEIRRVALTGR